LGNQQAKVTDIEYGWVAGFFDGEGSVIISIRAHRDKHKKNQTFQPACKIAATDPESLDRLHSILSRAGMAHHVAWSQPRGQMVSGRAYRPAWVIAIVGLSRVERFLTWLLPALATKQERAGVCLEYIRQRRAHLLPTTPITDEEIALAFKMRELNGSKSVRPPPVTINREPPKWPDGHHAAVGLKGNRVRWGAVTSLNDRTPAP
jgi:hypothetical protein